ncbi:hypothetical protein GUJ93_ZPchr0001g29670 [Zizania palustris]|uniref:Uncharacterized protein n=1 Tax=Zizania palustris TaxID=103762 RepID=A0A8J5RBB0_ZIZPA|nr:hypothetical protein GUJ93_ZPchr0001g29670 [Zizania palustris]
MEKGDETLASPAAAARDEFTATVDGRPAKSYVAVVAEKIPNGTIAEDEVTVTTAWSYVNVSAEKTSANGSVQEDEVAVTAPENPAKSYTDVVAEKTPNGSIGEDEVTVTTAEHPASSYADVSAEKTSANGSVPEDEAVVTSLENPAKSYGAVVAEKTMPNSSFPEDEVAVTTLESPAKFYATVAADAEIEDLRTTNLDLKEKLADADLEDKALATEAHRLEGLFSQVMEDGTTAEYSTASSDKETVSLREELKQLQHFIKAENGDHEMDKRNSEQLDGKVGFVRQEKVRLQGEINDMKKKAIAATAAPADETEAAPTFGEAGVAWPGMTGAAAAVAFAATVGVLLYLRLKR